MTNPTTAARSTKPNTKKARRRRRTEAIGIALIDHKRIPSCEGSAEIVVDELVTRMIVRGGQAMVYNRKGHSVAGEEFDNQSSISDKPYTYRGVKTTPVMTIDAKGLVALTSSLFATLKAIKARPDVIHYHAEGPCALLRPARWAGIRTVVTIYGLDWQRARWGRFASMYLELGERTAAKRADEVIVLGRGVQQYFRSTYGRKIRLVPNDIALVGSASSDVITDKRSLEKDSYVLFLGRIVPEKGAYHLIEVSKQLDTDKGLMIAGDVLDSAEHYESIKQAATGDQRIILTGLIEGRELEELYSNAYIYVLFGDLEDMPMSLLEALACGYCCLTSSITECTDISCGEFGIIYGVTFRYGDVNDLIGKLSELPADVGKVQKIKTGAANYITDRYSQDKVVQVTLKLY